MTNIAIKNTPFSSLIYPLNIVNFHSYVNVYQRVNLHFPIIFLWFSQLCSARLTDDVIVLLHDKPNVMGFPKITMSSVSITGRFDPPPRDSTYRAG